MPGSMPGIHVFRIGIMDDWDELGHDGGGTTGVKR